MNSLFAKIENAEHTFVAFAEKEYTKLYNSAPKIEQMASVAIKYSLPAISLIVGAEAGAPAAAMVNAVGVEAQKDLITASSLIYDFGPNPQATSLISGVADNLSGLLTAGHITSATSVAKVTGVVNNLTVLSTAMQVTVAAVKASAPAPATSAAPAVASTGIKTEL